MPLSFVLHHSIKSRPERIQPFFEHMERFGDLHPLIKGVTQTGPNEYLIRERMAFSFFTFNYKATVSVHNGNEVHYIAYPFFLTLTIAFKFSFLKAENHTVITESVHIKGPFIVAFILKAFVKKAHKKVVVNLKKTVE